jgi:hypothetical protein
MLFSLTMLLVFISKSDALIEIDRRALVSSEATLSLLRMQPLRWLER